MFSALSSYSPGRTRLNFWRVKAHDHDPPLPLGRVAYIWLIKRRHGTCPSYVDLSVMPRG